MAAKVFRMAGWFKIMSAAAMLLLTACGAYFIMWGESRLYQAGGIALVVFGIAGFADTMVSRIILDDEEIRLISLVRTRRYPRADFESAKVEGGAVALKRRDGGWLVLPSSGANALGTRNTVDAWIKRR